MGWEDMKVSGWLKLKCSLHSSLKPLLLLTVSITWDVASYTASIKDCKYTGEHPNLSSSLKTLP